MKSTLLVAVIISLCGVANAQQHLCVTKNSADIAYLALRDGSPTSIRLIETPRPCVDIWLRSDITSGVIGEVERRELRDAIALARGIVEPCADNPSAGRDDLLRWERQPPRRCERVTKVVSQ